MVCIAGRKVLPQGMGNISALLLHDLSACMGWGTNVQVHYKHHLTVNMDDSVSKLKHKMRTTIHSEGWDISDTILYL
jgi:hypothetical protein